MKTIKIEDQEINISDESFQSIKDQITEETIEPLKSKEELIGKKFFFRTVTYYQVGLVVGIFDNVIQLENASWIADSGNFMTAIKKGELSEVEPVGTCFINMQSLVDFFPWNHDLPTEQK